MHKKAISVITTFLLLVTGLLLFASAVVFKAWASTNKCAVMQGNCQGIRFSFCSKWVTEGVEPTEVDWTKIKTCKRTDDSYQEIPCPKPDLTECKQNLED